jgi:Flp pilus assembly protein TadD/Zn-dependent protease
MGAGTGQAQRRDLVQLAEGETVALRFKLLDVPIAIGIDFIVIMLVLGALWRTPEELPAWMAVVTGSVLLHELGHAAVFDYFGVKPSIVLHGGGGLTFGTRVTPRQHILVAVAGPGMGLVVGGIVGLAALGAPRLATNPIVEDLLWVNLGWSLINLLPFPGVDGGSIVVELTTIVLGRPAETAGRIVGMVVVGLVFVALILAGLYYWAFVVGFFAGWRFLQATLRATALSGVKAAGAPNDLLVAGRYEEAFHAARVAMADHPTETVPVLLASDALLLMSQYADAEWGYDKVARANPVDPRALRGLAYVRRRLGRTAEADADLAALLRLPSAGAAIQQAAALYDANRHADGYKLVAESLRTATNPTVARVLQSYLAMFEYTLGREDLALRDIDALIGSAPGDAAMHEQRALILCDLGRSDEARVEIRRALADKPRHPSYHETMGLVERMAGNAPVALQLLVDSAAPRPSDPRARAELAVCQIQLGGVGEARAALETLPGYSLRDPFVAYARAALAIADRADDRAIELLSEAGRGRPELAVRAGADPLFRTLLADPARRAALAGAIAGANS